MRKNEALRWEAARISAPLLVDSWPSDNFSEPQYFILPREKDTHLTACAVA